ncbi:maleylpyruvate isomerase family mycothiol-dependent enzyme [Actinotalea sp. AC32]|nr:maleylpyruvate isomerase family mycothiol-dependent enzyme [Actinotalea sp. AC32]
MSAADLDHLEHLVALQEAFSGTARGADLSVRVPWCGRWRVRDLVVHLARIHHWAAAQAGRSREAPLGRGPFEDPVGLYDRCAEELGATLLALGPDAIGSTLVGPGPASFWRRRQRNETLVHLWDLRTALGQEVDAPAAAWLDVVDEVARVMHPRQVALGRMAATALAVDLLPEDADGGPVRLGRQEGAADVRVGGSATTLALLVWGRAGLGTPGVTVDGDRAGLEDLLRQRITP